MFTGIVEEIGFIMSVRKIPNYTRLSIKGNKVFDALKLGDSVAVNGVCLTVAEFDGNIFIADVMNETLNRSNLSELQPGWKVNLERAMRANDRFGGHIVSGHIDGTGRIIKTERDGNAVWVTISADRNILKYIVEKGSVAIDGISLTVARVTECDFAVSIIPHTGNVTTLLDKKDFSTVNIENDMVGKYIEKFLSFRKIDERQKSKITEEFLINAGF
ncbi:MAG: riboflavin synthase [Clostridiales bacterium]|nr:riboflavin synthase [Clostridiales bacterium]